MQIKQLIAILSELPQDASVVLGPNKLPANEDYRRVVRVEPRIVEVEGARILRVHKADMFTTDVYVLIPSN